MRTKKQGITFKVHPAGLAAMAAAALLLDSRTVLSALIALTLHEGAHLLVMRLCGIRSCRVELTPFGGMADASGYEQLSSGKRMGCAMAGVAGSALAAALCVLWAPRTLFWKMCFQSNAALALLNVLPAWPLDGARALAAIAGCLGKENAVRKALAGFTFLMGAFLIVLGLYGVWHGIFNLSLLAMGPYLWYAACAEGVSAKVRRLHSAHCKLKSRSIWPVQVWAGTMESNLLGSLLGRMGEERYHLYVQLNSQNGTIEKVWTEGEITKYMLGNCHK